MLDYDWFLLYQEALTEVDPQKHLNAVEIALKALAERVKVLPPESRAEREAILTAATALSELRRYATESKARDDEYLAQAG